VLQCVAVCCSVLQCVAAEAKSSQQSIKLCSTCVCVAVCCNVLQWIAVRCSALQCVAVCCSVLQLRQRHKHIPQNSAAPVYVLQCIAMRVAVYVAVCCSVLQFVAAAVTSCHKTLQSLYMCCSMLQRVLQCMWQCVL